MQAICQRELTIELLQGPASMRLRSSDPCLGNLRSSDGRLEREASRSQVASMGLRRHDNRRQQAVRLPPEYALRLPVAATKILTTTP